MLIRGKLLEHSPPLFLALVNMIMYSSDVVMIVSILVFMFIVGRESMEIRSRAIGAGTRCMLCQVSLMRNVLHYVIWI